jgi:hypothetical protein
MLVLLKASANGICDSNARGEINVKITDFGLSRFSQVGVVGMEKNQNAAGPLKWMAPGTLLLALAVHPCTTPYSTPSCFTIH